MTDFLHQRCAATPSHAMDRSEIDNHLREVGGWAANGVTSIEKTFSFKNYHETIAFVNALAWICHVEDHHPELVVGFDRCVVRFDTHVVGGVSLNDFICAAKANALVAFVG